MVDSEVTCQSRVYQSGWSQPCGRKATGVLVDGSPACGPHIAGEKRSLKVRERHQAEAERRRMDDLLGDQRVAELQERGLSARTLYVPNFGSGLGRYDPDRMVVAYEDLVRLLDQTGR